MAGANSKVFAPIIVIGLSLVLWFGLTASLVTGASFYGKAGLLSPKVGSVLIVGLASLISVAAVITWNRISANRDGHNSMIPTVIIVAFGLFALSIIGQAIPAILEPNLILLQTSVICLSALLFLSCGAVIGLVVSLIPHVAGVLSSFRTDLIIMSAIPSAGVVAGLVPYTLIFYEIVYYPAFFFILPVSVVILAIVCFCMKRYLLRLRQSFIEEALVLFQERRGRPGDRPHNFDEEPRPALSAWKTLRLVRPYPPMLSLVLAAYVAAFWVTSEMTYDINASAFPSNTPFHFLPNCTSLYSNTNVALCLFAFPACFVPLLVHLAFFRQHEAIRLQPILAAILAVGPPLARSYLGPHVFDFDNCDWKWGLFFALLAISVARAALVAAAYVDLLYQVYLAAGDISMAVGSGVLGPISGSVGILVGAMNTLLLPGNDELTSVTYDAVVFTCPCVLLLGIIITITWRECRPIAIEL